MALRKPPLRDVHADRNAKFTEFGGWDMPVEFESIRAEHAAVRESVGIFDVSHMGELEVSGPDATTLMQRLTTNDVTRLAPGDSQYAAITTEEGIMLDDTVVYCLPDSDDDDPSYLFVPNAGHDEQMHDRWTTFRDENGLDATVRNATDEWAMVAVQGPEALGVVTDALGAEPALDRFEMAAVTLAGADCLLARTGYTGEDGVEVLCPWDDATRVWSLFADELGCTPCGLGARDTLRTEMGFLLSGQDFHPEDEPRNPYEADIGFAVALETAFVGRDALAAVAEAGTDERFVGLELLDRGIARHGYDITDDDGHVVGHVTSGTMSPTLETPIALGYLPTAYADPGTRVDVVVRGKAKRAKVVSTPFIDR